MDARSVFLLLEEQHCRKRNANKLGVYEHGSEKKADRLVYEPGRGSKGAIGIHRVQDGKWYYAYIDEVV